MNAEEFLEHQKAMLIDAINETQSKQSTEGLRDYFAAAAMQGLIAITKNGAIPSVTIASDLAYKYADAMLKERERGEMSRQCPQYATDEQAEEYKKQVEGFLKNQNTDRDEMAISLDLFEAWGMGKHTNAPWAVNHQMGIRIESEKEHGWANDGWIIAELQGPDAEANANLIAAAPELLESLERFIAWVDKQNLPYESAMVRQAKSAIAKAKGDL